MEKMKMNESTKYFVDLTVSIHKITLRKYFLIQTTARYHLYKKNKMYTSNVIICVNYSVNYSVIKD